MDGGRSVCVALLLLHLLTCLQPTTRCIGCSTPVHVPPIVEDQKHVLKLACNRLELSAVVLCCYDPGG